MDGGQAEIEHHHDGQVIASVQEAGEDGQEVADVFCASVDNFLKS